ETEVIAHLVAELYTDTGDPLAAVRAAIRRLEGSYAFAIIFADHPGRIVVAREGSPLLLGRGRGEHLIASDVPALLPHAHEVCQLQDGWIADIRAEQVTICDGDGAPVEGCFSRIELAVDDVSRGEFDSFMEKEIAEQPEVLQRLLDSRLIDGRLAMPEISVDLARINHVVFLACGTSWHAALLGKRFLEGLARIHVEVDISSEYRYRNPVASGDTLVVAISQSGETADTLAGVRLARSKFMPVASLVNVLGSTMARESDGVLPLLAGPEIGVASTKAYTAQVLALYLFALQLAQAKGRLDDATRTRLIDACCALPDLTAQTLAACREAVDEATELFSAANASVFLGRCGEYPTALEGALKLKEIAYVHATGYAAGEFKHGPIALVTDALPVICMCPRDQMFEKMLANVEETRARDGRIITVGPEEERRLHDLSDVVFPVPAPPEEMLQPLISILPLQLYALLVAQRRSCDVDQPRNLAKSVTVE
ncbi:MAG: glutamine--fructose-6-phosphate transaminase (isomerizing), partial [Planctomycetota bacterium]